MTAQDRNLDFDSSFQVEDGKESKMSTAENSPSLEPAVFTRNNQVQTEREELSDSDSG